MRRFEPVLDRLEPSCVIVVGDVNSTLACSLVAVKKRHAGRPRRGGPAELRPRHARRDQPHPHRSDRRSPVHDGACGGRQPCAGGNPEGTRPVRRQRHDRLPAPPPATGSAAGRNARPRGHSLWISWAARQPASESLRCTVRPMSTSRESLRESLSLLRDVAATSAADLARASARARQHRAIRLVFTAGRSRVAFLRRRATSRCRDCSRTPPGADGLRWNPGRDDGTERALPHDARQHGTSRHRGPGHQYARRPQSRACAGMRGRRLLHAAASAEACRNSGTAVRPTESPTTLSAGWVFRWRGASLPTERERTPSAGVTAPPGGIKIGRVAMNPRDAADGSDSQRAHHRRGGLLPGIRVCRPHFRERTGTACRAASKRTSTVSSGCSPIATCVRRSSPSAGSLNATRR